MTSKAFFYSNTSIIKNDLLRCSAKMLKSFYDPFQKAFFILPVKSGNKDIPAVAFTHTPYLDFLPDPAKYYSCFTPIHLNGFGWVIGQWYKPMSSATVRLTVASQPSNPHSATRRVYILCAVCCCFRGAFWSESRHFMINALTSSVMMSFFLPLPGLRSHGTVRPSQYFFTVFREIPSIYATLRWLKSVCSR